MIKTQIQVPDEQMARIREFARKREWTLAETFRRGAEVLLQQYGGDRARNEEWEFPTLSGGEWQGLDDEALRDLVAEDETRLPQ